MTSRAMISGAGLTLAAVLSVAGCSGGEESYEQEVILQLFKSRALTLGPLTVDASQVGGKVGSPVEIADEAAFFSSCERNRVRIIPAVSRGVAPVIDVHITSSSGEIAPVQQKFTSAGLKPVILGPAADLVPAACAPAGAPDAGSPADSAVDGGQQKPTGAACEKDDECVGGKCLHVFTSAGLDETMPDGYCSRPCDGMLLNGCEPGEQCKASTDGSQGIISGYCLQACDSRRSDECRPGYKCTVIGGLCYPSVL